MIYFELIRSVSEKGGKPLKGESLPINRLGLGMHKQGMETFDAYA